MKNYRIISTAFEGEVLVSYDDKGLLLKCDTTGATLSEEQQVFFLRNMPISIGALQGMMQISKTTKLEEVQEREIDFETFWKRYDEKIRSSKKKTEKIWQRLSATDRNKAYYFITKYEMSIPNGVAKKYAETYLNAELWNN